MEDLLATQRLRKKKTKQRDKISIWFRESNEKMIECLRNKEKTLIHAIIQLSKEKYPILG